MKQDEPVAGAGSMSLEEISRMLETQNEELVIQQKQLLAAADQMEMLNEELKHANQVKSDFVSMVVHDIRNPLASVSQSIEVARDLGGAELPEKTRHYLEIAQRNVWRLNQILSDLLDLAKMEAGKLHMEPDACLPEDLVSEAASFSKADADVAGVNVILDVSAPLPVLADAGRIVQVLGNFMSNAVKFTPEGGRITIGASPSQGGVTFFVSDTGGGIAREHQKIIFEKYRQLGTWQGGGKRGTGMGLPICKNLITLHNSSIEVASEPGKGARFSFELSLYSLLGRAKVVVGQISEKPPTVAWKLAAEEKETWKNLLTSVRRLMGEGEWQMTDPDHGFIWVLSALPEKTEGRLEDAVRLSRIPKPKARIDLPKKIDAAGLAAIIEANA